MKVLNFVIYRARYAAAIVGLSIFALLTTSFYVFGVLQPDAWPGLFASYRELLGTVIVLTLGPTLLSVFLILGQRRSLGAVCELFEGGISDQGADAWLGSMKARVPLSGAGLGMLYAVLFNIPPLWLFSFFELDSQTRSIAVAQVVAWSSVGLTLSYRFHTAFSFNRLGRTVQLDLLDTRSLAPFAKNGVDDVLAIALLLALSTTQSLDAEFRFANYAAIMLVALPAAAFLFALPMISIHRRLVRSRTDYLEEMNRQIASTSRQLMPDAIQNLELLMLHRDRLRETSTWPLDSTIYSRLAFYVILPPIAWLGAAVVEFGVDRILTDP